MTASDMLRRTLALQDTLQRLVELLQADELDERYCDDLDAAVHAADTLSDDEKERLRRRASDLRDTNPAEARRIVALLHGEGLPA